MTRTSGTFPAVTASVGLDHRASDPDCWTMPQTHYPTWIAKGVPQVAPQPKSEAHMLGYRLGEFVWPAMLAFTLGWLCAAILRIAQVV